MSTQDTTLPPLPEPAFKRVCLKYAGGDTPSLYREGWVIVDLDAFSADQMRAAIAAQAPQPVVSAYRVNTKGGRSWVVNGAPSASDLAEIENMGDSVELLGATVKESLTPQQAQQAQGVPAAALKRIKQNLMHQRLFGADSLGAWRMAATQAEGDIEELLAAAPQAEPSQQAQGAPAW